jgi:hypothetical protein
MSNKKQNSIEWLWKYIMDNPFGSFQDGVNALNKAKELHRQEITDAYGDGLINWDSSKDAEQYYKETYGGENNEELHRKKN